MMKTPQHDIERDVRQLRIIVDILQQVRSDSLTELGKNVARIDAALGQVSDDQHDLKKVVFDLWFTLEQIYAFALASGVDQVSGRQATTVAAVTSQIRDLCLQRIHELENSGAV
jgi:hypothetical protein